MKYIASRKGGTIGLLEGVDIVPRPGCHVELGSRPIETGSVAALFDSPAPAYGLGRVGRDTPQQLQEPAKRALARVAVRRQAAAVPPSYDGWHELELIP